MELVASDSMISVITTSYNQLPTLKLLLASLERQTEKGFEVIVADDGSSDGTGSFCAEYKALSLRIVTQPDEGYRKAKIVNEAVRVAKGDYLVFLDSDVIVERHFLEDHLRLRAQNAFVCGRRVDLGPKFTKTVTLEDVRTGGFDRPSLSLLRSHWEGDSTGVKRAFRVTPHALRKVMGYTKPIDILGSNFSIWKEDLQSVNGFNEALQAYWGEDGDLFVRLRNSGKRAINAKGMCIQYHVFHARRQPTAENVELVSRMLARTDYIWAEKGLSGG